MSDYVSEDQEFSKSIPPKNPQDKIDFIWVCEAWILTFLYVGVGLAVTYLCRRFRLFEGQIIPTVISTLGWPLLVFLFLFGASIHGCESCCEYVTRP